MTEGRSRIRWGGALAAGMALMIGGMLHGQEEEVPVRAETRESRPTRPIPPPQDQYPLDGLIPVTTKSGLTYYDIKEGTGKAATPVSRVSFNYVVWLPDGTTFDSNAKLGKPATVRLWKPEIIEGWKEGIGTMREGGIRRLEVPWQLGYGESGKPPVGPKQDLIFEIQLVKVHDDDGSTPPRAPVLVEAFHPAKVPPQTPVEGLEPRRAESGLTIWTLKEGDGAAAGIAALVSVDYSCWLKNGTPVESSVAMGHPASFDVRATPIRGLGQAVVGMHVGGKRKVEIPAFLAYGAKGMAPGVPPDSDLICEVALLKIEEADLVKRELGIPAEQLPPAESHRTDDGSGK